MGESRKRWADYEAAVARQNRIEPRFQRFTQRAVGEALEAFFLAVEHELARTYPWLISTRDRPDSSRSTSST